jgi:uncharacterized repeat protein (TIGR03943 family)
VNREAQSVLLVLVGGAILRITVDGTYLRYVKAGLWPFLFGAALVILLVGILSLLDVTFRRRGDAAAHDAAEHAPGEAPRAAWLLALPVFAIFLVAPPALGSYAASRDSGTVAAPADDTGFPPLAQGDPVAMPVGEYAVRAVWDRGRSLKGRTVKLTGFVTPKRGGGWYVTRIALSCCAADGQAIKVETRGADPLPADTWVEVTGSYEASGAAKPEEAPPVLAVESVRELPAPADPYE